MAQKEINRIPSPYYQKIITTFTILGSDPFCGKKLRGKYKDRWGFRVWPYRIIYEIKNFDLIVLAIKVNHGQGVY